MKSSLGCTSVLRSITTDAIVAVMKDTLLRLNLRLSHCRGQCYDGGSNMTGSKNGVKAQILRDELRALFTHCYGNALSFSIADTVRVVKCLESTIDTVHELSKLLQYSPSGQLSSRILRWTTLLGFVFFVQCDGQCVMKRFAAFWIIAVH